MNMTRLVGLARLTCLLALGFVVMAGGDDGAGGRSTEKQQHRIPGWGGRQRVGSEQGVGADSNKDEDAGHYGRGKSQPQTVGDTPSIWFVEPAAGSKILSAPFLVKMGASGFRVPEDGEVRITMVYEGMGTQVRVLQGLEFMCWNVAKAALHIEAQLISTKDDPVGEAAHVHVTQSLETFFSVSSPTDGDLFFASRPIPVLFMLSGFGARSDLLESGGGVCAHMTCIGRESSEMRVCTSGPEGVGLSVEGGKYKMNVGAKPGNCTMSITVTDGEGGQVGKAEQRRVWVVDEQGECPAESGVVCLYGRCDEISGEATCVCAEGYEGRGCDVKRQHQQRKHQQRKHQQRKQLDGVGDGQGSGCGGDSISRRYINIVKDALLDTVYAKDRPGETAVVARSMVGRQGLDDLEAFVWDVLERKVPGDLMETGVWQGGSCILMRAVLEASGVQDRKVWVVDSFEGCPIPNEEEYPHDAGDKHHTFENLAVPLAKVRSNFADFGLLDDQVEFVRGWFEDTMQSPRIFSIESIALLRLDGDLYQSTYEVLRGVYHKVSIGGLVVVDDWRLDGMQARGAVIDFHRDCNLIETIHVGTDGLAWWKKEVEGSC